MKPMLTLFLLVAFNITIAAENAQTIKLEVTEAGFKPNSINVKPGTDVILGITRKTNATCATQIKVPSKKITEDLPLNKEVKVHLGKLNKGEVKFSCGMDMVSGVILVK